MVRNYQHADFSFKKLMYCVIYYNFGKISFPLTFSQALHDRYATDRIDCPDPFNCLIIAMYVYYLGLYCILFRKI